MGRIAGVDIEREQAVMDLEDARLRLQGLALAIARKDEAELLVRELRAKLKQALRKAKEAGWDLSVLLQKERQAGVPQNGNAKGGG